MIQSRLFIQPSLAAPKPCLTIWSDVVFRFEEGVVGLVGRDVVDVNDAGVVLMVRFNDRLILTAIALVIIEPTGGILIVLI